MDATLRYLLVYLDKFTRLSVEEDKRFSKRPFQYVLTRHPFLRTDRSSKYKTIKKFLFLQLFEERNYTHRTINTGIFISLYHSTKKGKKRFCPILTFFLSPNKGRFFEKKYCWSALRKSTRVVTR